ncbi:extensin family protein [Pseudomonas sp. 3A(2025)]
MRVMLLILLLCGLATLSVWRGWVDVPPRWNPWAPLDVRAEPNFLTSFKLGRLQDDPALCDQALATSTLRYSRQADSPASARCPLSNTLRIQGGDVALSSSFLASCPLAVAYAMFEYHSLQSTAQDVLGQRIARIDHLGSFACRNIYNRSEGRLSQHASANALDIAGFRLADGQRIDLLKDWSDSGNKGRFLKAIQQAACTHFNTVLGPEYNAAHRNHFHLDMGLWRVCR